MIAVKHNQPLADNIQPVAAIKPMMKQMLKTIVAMMVLCWVPLSATAQKVVLVQGVAQGFIRDDVAKTAQVSELILKAQAAAIQNEFGTMVLLDEQFELKYENPGEGSSSAKRYANRSNSMARGIWLDQLSDPVVEENTDPYSNKELTVSVRGYAAPMSLSSLAGMAEVHGCADFNCPTRNFLEGSGLYVQFQSAHDGYLAVGVEDLATHQVYFVQSADGDPVETAQNRPQRIPDNDRAANDYELALKLDDTSEMGRHYVWFLFSEEAFSTPALTSEDDLPANVDAVAFRKWLRKSLLINDSLQFQQVPITVVSNENIE